METHEEKKIEIQTGELVTVLQKAGFMPGEPWKHNQTIIPGHKDIGLNGWIVFILRKQEEKHAAENKAEVGRD